MEPEPETAADPSAEEPVAVAVPAIEADPEPDAASETTPGA